ncbi:hypothetical protein MO867_11555 [Microbulbifer sp. OS29]|uniref:Uncharacterized protein n=1 Tax=Microbulbifer okhotskensis TaxID=2926617 RepID=A0A9X2EMG3_9GAMM|nr:hypothetical protein [Microbulbifer okhotskensis]MCO1334972.1 hypothetical protein [Microbulbifer okhotskensis]
MAHPIYKDLLEQWREKAKEIAGTSEGFTFYDPEFNEFLHWMFSQFQAVGESTQPAPDNSVVEFINKGQRLREQYPSLCIEVASTKKADWMAWVGPFPDDIESTAFGFGSTPEEACKESLGILSEIPEVMEAIND